MFEPYVNLYSLYGLGLFSRHKAKSVRHRQTCPVCGRTLVNLYWKDGKWKCKKCWDAEDTEKEKMINDALKEIMEDESC